MTPHLESGKIHLVTTKPESDAESEDQRSATERRISYLKRAAYTATTEAELDALYAGILKEVQDFKEKEKNKEKDPQDPEAFFTDLFQKMDEVKLTAYSSHAIQWFWEIDKDTRYIDMGYGKPTREMAQPVDESIGFSHTTTITGRGKESLLQKIKDKKIKRSIIAHGKWYIELE